MLRASLVGVLLASAPAALEAQRPDPLGHLVTKALRTNLGLEAERLAERRAAADVREARGRFFPSLGLDSRYSHFDGVPNVGELVNPAYAALNGLLGENRFPTNLDITLPPRHDSRLELRQPLIEIKTSILLVDLTNRLRAEGMGLEEAIRKAGEVRFLPNVLTSLTAIGGLPIALQGTGLYAPLAWVIIGGLVSSTLLARIVTPVMYKLLAPHVEAVA